MTTTARTFDNQIARWNQEMELPWAKLKYKLIWANLAKHLGHGPLCILDVGGGNGRDALFFADQGHSVDIVDYSQEMLADIPTQPHITTHHAKAEELLLLFPNTQFDLLLCHNVLQYINDVPALISSFAKLLKPNGLLSIVSLNRFSASYHAAFLDNNFDEAIKLLNTRVSKTKIFETDVVGYSADEISTLLKSVGLTLEQDYGIRCLTDYWGDNQKKLDTAIFEQIERFEFAATELYPYKLLARYFQVVARMVNNA